MLPQLRNSQANPAVADAPRPATSSPGAPDATKPPDPYRQDLERTLRLFEGAGIAVFPARRGTKGTYVPGWPEMTVAGALSLTRAELDRGRINLAARTGDGWPGGRPSSRAPRGDLGTDPGTEAQRQAPLPHHQEGGEPAGAEGGPGPLLVLRLHEELRGRGWAGARGLPRGPQGRGPGAHSLAAARISREQIPHAGLCLVHRRPTLSLDDVAGPPTSRGTD